MSLQEQLEQLEPRERRLLALLGVVLAALCLVLGPLAVAALVGGRQSENAALRDAIFEIQRNRGKVAEVERAREALKERYSRPAPPLASFLAGLARAHEIEIPETQDADTKPHGKRYEERLTNIVLRRVSMYNFVRFLEAIRNATHPVSVTRLSINKRSGADDSFDIQMTVSAYDRKVVKAAAASEGAAP